MIVSRKRCCRIGDSVTVQAGHRMMYLKEPWQGHDVEGWKEDKLSRRAGVPTALQLPLYH
jgi:hypothetical protein